MLQGIQYSQNGLENKKYAIDVIANNLANASSAGFKKSIVFSESLKNADSNPKANSQPLEVVDTSQGALRATGNTLDLAIEGEGFFVIDTEQGTRLTRQGHFQLDTEGFLVTANGDYVMSDGGPVSAQQEIQFTAQGGIIADGEPAGSLMIYQVTDSSKLQRSGDGYFSADERYLAELDNTPNVRSGFLESSNVNPLEEMVNLIEIYRQFEANQRALRTQDETLDKAVNDVGRV